jgi:uncharacterized 2Fe-2S/4Fe-4S cluster protein (DUF4445 family)
MAREDVTSACIVGNTAMTHLLLDLPIDQLAVAPFVPAVDGLVERQAMTLGLSMASSAPVRVLPCIGGFVGADHVAMILATGLDDSEVPTLGIDIGTNTEISLYRPDSSTLHSTSCASGPAFEGAHIRDGMRASPGAIESVSLRKGRFEVATIGNEPPVGLCGSGIVDAVAALWQQGLVNRSGRFARGAPGVREREGGLEIVIVPAHRSGIERDIAITQSDIGEVQMAKGAIRAGIETLLVLTQTSIEELEMVLLAGAFGSSLNLASAQTIGLIPPLLKAPIVDVGNAAGAGAKMALLSAAALNRASIIAGRANHVNIENDSGFTRRFAEAMRFPELRST